MKILAVFILTLIGTLTTADILRTRDTGEIIAKGHGRIVPASSKDSQQPGHKSDIEWMDCDGNTKVYEDADKYHIDEGDNCVQKHEPHNMVEPPGNL
ncbi:MAG TPA: hypothetical protein VG759_11965 [Candidatus Angelobacter sp.]|jgi:hypothetical protein|nr:hypothetical protein [Candidatus Angelobacter sp.]